MNVTDILVDRAASVVSSAFCVGGRGEAQATHTHTHTQTHTHTHTDTEYELPKKTYISQTAIPSLYNKVKDDTLKEIKDISLYSATTALSVNKGVFIIYLGYVF